MRTEPSYDREPFRVRMVVPSNERTQVSLNLEKAVPPEGYYVDMESLVVSQYRTWDPSTQPNIRSQPGIYPIQIANLIEPPFNIGGNLSKDQKVYFYCDQGALIGNPDETHYSLFATKRIAMGDITQKMWGRELQRVIEIEPFTDKPGDMVITLLFYPSTTLSNPTNTNMNVSN